MMAHELPLPIHSKPTYKEPQRSALPPKGAPNKKKSTKGKQQASSSSPPSSSTSARPPVRLLPNGEAVDFGGNKKQSKKQNQCTRVSIPQLPNGSHPVFTNDQKPSKGSKKSLKHEQSLPNGSKPNFRPSGNTFEADDNQVSANSGSTGKSKKKSKSASNSKKPVEDTYAGSSFHSSPAALALPKPTFKSTSPKNQVVKGDVTSNSNVSNNVNGNSSNNGPAIISPLQANMTIQSGTIPLANQMMAPPPVTIPGQPHPHLIYPVAPYGQPAMPPVYPSPMSHPLIHRGNQFVQNGYTYQHTPSGNINYQINGAGHFPTPPHQQNVHGAPVSQISTSYTPHGQKISFNELLGSSTSN